MQYYNNRNDYESSNDYEDDTDNEIYRTQAELTRRRRVNLLGCVALLALFFGLSTIITASGYFIYVFFIAEPKVNKTNEVKTENKEGKKEKTENSKGKRRGITPYPKEIREKFEEDARKTQIQTDKLLKNKTFARKESTDNYSNISNNNLSKPIKNIDNYFRMTKEQLIEEVKDSQKNDYEYNEKGNYINPNEVRNKLIFIAKGMWYPELLDEILSNGFAPKYTTATNTIDVTGMLLPAATHMVFKEKKAFIDVLIKHGANLKTENNNGYNLLHAGASVGNMYIIETALNGKVPVNKKTSAGNTPVMIAIKNGYYDIVKVLADNGAELEENFCELTNSRKILRLIIEKCNPNDLVKFGSEATNKEWEEAYDYISNADFDSLKTLAECGTDLSKMSYNGESALLLATRKCGLNIIAYLLKNFDCKKTVDSINKRNSLHYAVMSNKIEALKLLLREGLDPNLTDKYGNTPLHYAAENHDIEFVKALIKNGADAKIINNKKRNALFYAVNTGNTAVFKNLLKNGADINQQDVDGNTPFLYAKKRLSTQAKSKLIELGANTKINNKEAEKEEEVKNGIKELPQDTTLHSAVLDNNMNKLKKLVFEAKDPDAINSQKQSALHIAVLNNNPQAVTLLLRDGASINQPDCDGNTPLHYIAKYAPNKEMLDAFYEFKDKKISMYKSSDKTNYVLIYYFDFSVQNKEGKTPRNIANKDCFEDYERVSDPELYLAKSKRVKLLLGELDEEDKKLGYRRTRKALTPIKIDPSKKKKQELAIIEKFKQRQKEENYNRLFGDNLMSNNSQLYKMREDFLAMADEQLAEEFNKIDEYTKSNFFNDSKNRQYFDLNTLFFLKIALDKDCPQLLEEILNSGFDINYWQINYYPPVLYAAKKNSQKCVDVFLNKNPDYSSVFLAYEKGRAYKTVSDYCRDDRELLYDLNYVHATNNISSKWGEVIINLDDDITDKEDYGKLDNGLTLLHCAAMNGNIALAEKLLNNGASVEQETLKGNTPLYYAVKNNKYDMASFLIKRGAKSNEELETLTNDSKMLSLLQNY